MPGRLHGALSTLTLAISHPALRSSEGDLPPFADETPKHREGKSSSWAQRRDARGWGALPQTTPHLCSWAGSHSMSHLTGRTSVESPPAPEGAGRRRRQTTCRRSLGPLSSHGPGRQDRHRTQLGRRRETGRSKLLSRTSVRAHGPHPSPSLCSLYCFPLGPT